MGLPELGSGRSVMPNIFFSTVDKFLMLETSPIPGGKGWNGSCDRMSSQMGQGPIVESNSDSVSFNASSGLTRPIGLVASACFTERHHAFKTILARGLSTIFASRDRNKFATTVSPSGQPLNLVNSSRISMASTEVSIFSVHSVGGLKFESLTHSRGVDVG